LSLVCFRACPQVDAVDEPSRNARWDALNEEVMHAVNRTGKAFLSHTRLKDKLTLRLSIGNIRTAEQHVREIWKLLNEQLGQLR